ncbi:hypothetical protein ABQF34_29275 [Mycolicibacterium boenickei]
MTVDNDLVLEAAFPGFPISGLSSRLGNLISMVQTQNLPTSPRLQHLYEELVEPLWIDERVHPGQRLVQVTIAHPGSPDAAMAATMLDWGYCSRYYSGNGEPELPLEPRALRSTAYTLVATIDVGHRSIMLGTLQVVIGPTVPALLLFDPVEIDVPSGDPGQSSADGWCNVGELRRFSVSPLLEVVSDDFATASALRGYRSEIYRAMYAHSLGLFREAGVGTIYGIATPQAHRFFTRSGMPMRAIQGARLRETAELRQLQIRFAGYWRPNGPHDQQPALYQIPYAN